MPSTTPNARFERSGPLSASRTNRGTKTAWIAPPAISSKSNVGTILAPWYTSPRRVAPKTALTTAIRARPVNRENRVRTVIKPVSRANDRPAATSFIGLPEAVLRCPCAHRGAPRLDSMSSPHQAPLRPSQQSVMRCQQSMQQLAAIRLHE